MPDGSGAVLATAAAPANGAEVRIFSGAGVGTAIASSPRMRLLSLVQTSLWIAIAAGCGSGQPATGPASDGKADTCADCNKLHPEDRLRIATERENDRWAETNIASSTATMFAGVFDDSKAVTDKALKASADELLRATFADDVAGAEQTLNDDVKTADPVEVDLRGPFDTLIEATATRAANDAFVFAEENEKDRDYIYWSIQHTIDWLGDDDAEIVGVDATATYRDDDGETRDTSLALFVNRDTRKFYAVYVRADEF